MIERDHLPGLSEREVLESLGPEALVEHIMTLGEKVSTLENKMNEAAEILEGVYGLTVNDVLSQRESQVAGEKQNEQ